MCDAQRKKTTDNTDNTDNTDTTFDICPNTDGTETINVNFCD